MITAKLSDNSEFTSAKLRIYCHNLSGAKGKISDINAIIATQNYDILALQETWFDSSVYDEEIIAHTNYKIHRMDRSNFNATRKNGGGVCLILNEEFETTKKACQRRQLNYSAFRSRFTNSKLSLLILMCLQTERRN